MTKKNNILLIDNIDKTLSRFLLDTYKNIQSNNKAEIKIASAFFSPSGFARLSDSLSTAKKVKILLGSEPSNQKGQWDKKLDESEEQFDQRQLKEGMEIQEDFIKKERNYFPFDDSSTQSILKMLHALKSGNIEVRRYEHKFLHAKAYLYIEDDNPINSVVIGSSNLTSSGLSGNYELNISNQNQEVIRETEVWFNKLWDDASPFDLAAFFEELFDPKDPFLIFLKVLWELYGDEILDDEKNDKNLPLTQFQKHGVERAIRLIDQCGGVIVADEVGLGKTFIAGEILHRYMDKRQRALIICPAALRDNTWKQFKSDFQLYVEVLSFEQLANDISLKDKYRPNADQNHLERDPDEYQLIIVDEAHNYRNPDAPHRAAVLRRLLYGKRKDVLFLTATPVNNSLWDLYHLTRFFLKQDTFLSNKGILSIRNRFTQAMRTDPLNLSPDLLYPIVDATTVKRTRQFVKKHYQNDYIKGPDGKDVPIVFPEPQVISIRYDLDEQYPELFDLIENALDENSGKELRFARYKSDTYKLDATDEDEYNSSAALGLIKTGILKRFESSRGAFKKTIDRLISQNESFLKALESGYVVNTAFLNEVSASDDDAFEDLLEANEESIKKEDFNFTLLQEDVEHDLNILKNISDQIKETNPKDDPKLKALVSALIDILKQAEEDGLDGTDSIEKRKVLIFSFFSDTVHWIRNYLIGEINNNPSLSAYKNRIKSVTGTEDDDDEERTKAVQGFAPKFTGSRTGEDLIDILITTDVLAEGVNLQQCRHIINYDLPWNPMRLVQRHGRIDRIGSPHNRIYLRTIFPVDRLDELLRLEERIVNKLAMAAASVGVNSPIESIEGGKQVFTETKEEIEKLLNEDASLFVRGGTKSSSQSGEEYRQTLRKALDENGEDLFKDMAWKSGSGFRSPDFNGYFFCAQVGDRTYLRLIETDNQWLPLQNNEKNKYFIYKEIATCLRTIECEKNTEIEIDELSYSNIYKSWELAKKDIWDEWMIETDPINLQPQVRPLNLKVRDFLRTQKDNLDNDKYFRAINILESPWPRREENLLRIWF